MDAILGIPLKIVLWLLIRIGSGCKLCDTFFKMWLHSISCYSFLLHVHTFCGCVWEETILKWTGNVVMIATQSKTKYLPGNVSTNIPEFWFDYIHPMASAPDMRQYKFNDFFPSKVACANCEGYIV